MATKVNSGKQGTGVKQSSQKITDMMAKNHNLRSNVNREDARMGQASPPSATAERRKTWTMEDVMEKLESLTVIVMQLRDDGLKAKEMWGRVQAVEQQVETNSLKCEVDKNMLQERIHYLERKEESRDKEARRNNIVIHGITVDRDEGKEKIEEILREQLDVDVGIVEAFPIGKTDRKKNSISVLAKLSSDRDKKTVMKYRHKLNGAEMYITHDRTVREREIQRKIMRIADEEERNGKIVRVGYRKLQVNETHYVWKDNDGLIEAPSGRGPSGSSREPTHSSQRMPYRRS